MDNGLLVHVEVDAATTVIFINHDDAIYCPDILSTESATSDAELIGLYLMTATKLIALAGHIKCTLESHFKS